MQSSRKILIYNNFNKSVLRIIRDRSTVATTVCPYASTQSTDANDLNEEQRIKNDVKTTYLPYGEVPGPKPLPILGNTWR
jgi:hypothetical protein